MTKRYLLLALGWVSLVLGVIGVFLPIMPTTPFILLAAWAFAKSSHRFYQWLVNHRHFGPIVRDWQSDRGVSRQVRNRVIGLLWLSLSCSSLLIGLMGHWWVAPLLGLGGIAITLYMLRLPLSDAPASDAGEH